jgi:uncharacterized protein DUF5060/uncharacterized protein DUF4038
MIRGHKSKLALICLFTVLLSISVRAKDLGTQTGTMWAPYREWSLTNKSYSDNPFDIVATVEFTHSNRQEIRTTEMFYASGDVWKFRFTGTRVGTWKFKTSSSNPELNGHTGIVTIKPNPDSKIRGFLTYQGNKYALQVGNEPKRQGYLFTVYMQRPDHDALNFTDWQTKDVEQYCAAAKRNGFEVIFIHVNNNWFRLGKQSWKDHASEDPDRKTFAVLEMIITTAHRQGCRVHFWAWGDESRKWTPIGVPGGINGKADRRLQQYIAARLGPLPGWTMGYGFDLHEWTKPEQLNAWAEFLHEHMGWQHLLCARGFKLEGPHNMHSYDGFGRNVEITTTSHGPKSYAEICEDLDSDTSRPHIYEERHSYQRDGFDLGMDGTRRLWWWEAMAGGMGGFFGFYPKSPRPYPNPEQLQTHYTFWHAKRRFRLDLARKNGFVLKNAQNQHYVVYQEDTQSIPLDLSQMAGSQLAVAVDTKKAYQEIGLGRLEAKKQMIELPRKSDWAIAVGKFE